MSSKPKRLLIVCSGSVKFSAAQGKKRLFTKINLPSLLIHSPPQRLL